MAAITTPYSLELGPKDIKKNVVAGTTTAVVAGKMKIFLGSGVNPQRQTSINGSLRACFRKLMAERLRKKTTGDLVARANYLGAADGNIVLESVVTNIGANDVAIVISETFSTNNASTQESDETFKELLASFNERNSQT